MHEALNKNTIYYDNLVAQQRLIIENLKNKSSTMYDTLNKRYEQIFINLLNVTTDKKIITLINEIKVSNLLNMNSFFDSFETISINDTALKKHPISNKIDFPNVLSFLPHLRDKDQAVIQPKFLQSTNRFVSIVIGIPTIKRDKTNYLLETVKSLLDNMSDIDKSDALIVIMISEVNFSIQKIIVFSLKYFLFFFFL
jgi:hypothetical protein